MRIKAVGRILFAILVAVNLMIVAIDYRWVQGFKALEKDWNSYSKNTEKKSVFITQMHQSLGYGGMIHSLKNYILRHEENNLVTMHQALKKIDIAITGYAELPLSAEEKQKLEVLKALYHAYFNAANLAEKLSKQGLTSTEIDNRIKVDDFDAISALAYLSNQIATERQGHLETIAAEVRQQDQTSTIAMAVSTFLLFGMALYFYWFIRRQLSAPIEDLLHAFEVIDPDKNVSERLPMAHKKTSRNELDELAMAGNRFLDAVEQRLGYQKQAEQKATESERRIATILNNTAEGIITIDGHGTVLSFNPKCEQLFGFTSDEIIGHNVDRLMRQEERLAHGDYLRQSSHMEKKVINTNRELWGMKKNGEIFPMELTVSSTNLNGKKSFIGIMHDISQRKTNEKKLLLAKEEAERANQTKSKFLSAMSHELRTPLNAILGFGQLMLMKKKVDELSENQRENTEQILKAGYHLLTLVNDILDLSKIESGQFDIEFGTTNLNKIIKQCLDLTEQQAESCQVSIELDASLEQNWQLHSNFTRLKQVLLNIITNAIKYNRSGGKVILKARQLEQNQLQIDICDTGVGIAEADHPHVFKPFQRFGAQQAAIEGTGIGLNVCFFLVQALGGKISFTSELNIGSTFTVILPLTQEEVTEKTIDTIQTKPTATAPDLRHTTILYIEDNAANRALMTGLMTSCFDLEFITANDAESGIEIAEEKQPDLIFMDINLPGINGFEALKRLKSHPKTKDIVVVALSAAATKKDIEKGNLADFKSYLTKPIVVTEVVALINELLNPQM